MPTQVRISTYISRAGADQVCVTRPRGGSANSIIGEVVVLMGPSGSGKTTLLNVLAHRDSAPGAEIEGEILVNGRKIDLETFRNISSYVEQEDILVGALTVEETLYFCAQLSLPR